MKAIRKNTIPLLFLLASCLLLSACDLSDLGFVKQHHDQLDMSDATQEESTDAAPTEATTEQPQESTTEQEKVNELHIIGLDANLVVEIVDYLQKIYYEYDMPADSFAIKINKIKKDGAQPLHVKFDPENYYYACAYYNPTHEHPEYEKSEYCCASDYTWVRFDMPDQITDQYEDLNFVCAFQVNRTLFCHDIGSRDGVSKNMEHYLRYTPEFVNGSNVASSFAFDECFIYLNDPNLETAYCRVDRQLHKWIAMPCMEFDGKYYVPYYTHMKDSDGTIQSSDLEWHFGEYYEYVMSIIVTDKYSISDDYGRTAYFGLIPVEGIAKIVSE